jgi:hypothetical protein
VDWLAEFPAEVPPATEAGPAEDAFDQFPAESEAPIDRRPPIKASLPEATSTARKANSFAATVRATLARFGFGA